MSTLTTRADHRTERHPVTALDGTPISLLRVHGRHEPTRGPVVLVHGAGVRAELFRPPTPYTLVDALIDDGWDVWLLDWRASIHLDPVPWTLDDAAAYDHPAAVRHIVRTTGSDTVKAFVHCQGSTSFTMSAVAGLLPQVDTVVSNAVSLHPVVPRFSRFKIRYMVPVVSRVTPHLSPAWGDRARGPVQRGVVGLVRTFHHECDNTVCRMVSFTYGTGHPALWSHDTIDDATHDWVRGEFAEVPMTFFRQMDRCIRAGHLVPVSERPGLPSSLVDGPPRTDARFVFVAGEDNRCFLPESQQRSFEFFDSHRPGRDTLHRVRGYGHLDVVFGKDAARDTYPMILEELRR